MKHLIFLAILVIALITPVTAEYVVTGNYAGSGGAGYPVTGTNTQSFMFSPNPDTAISVVEYDLPLNTRVDFTLTYGTGATVSGYMEYLPAGPIGYSTSTVSLGGMTRTENFYDAQALGYALTKHVQFSSYGMNTSSNPPETGFVLYAQGFGLWSNEIVFYPVPNISNNMISSIAVTSTQGINIAVENSDRAILATTLEQTAAQSIASKAGEISNDIQRFITLALQAGNTIFDLSVQAFYWIKFMFWDHLLITIALYIGITGAMAFGQNIRGGVFKALKAFVGYQMALFKGIIAMWQSLIDLIDRFRNIFRL